MFLIEDNFTVNAYNIDDFSDLEVLKYAKFLFDCF